MRHTCIDLLAAAELMLSYRGAKGGLQLSISAFWLATRGVTDLRGIHSYAAGDLRVYIVSGEAVSPP